MESFLLENELTIHSNFFYGALLAAVLIEVILPLREQRDSLRPRWTGNFLLGVVNVALERMLIPLLGMAVAFYTLEKGWGILNNIEVPTLVSIPLSILILDLVNYFQHRLFHQSPWLWRLHKVHHSDPAMDFSTTFRFHPVESLLSPLFIFAAVILLGTSPIAYFVYAMLIVATSFISHANCKLPSNCERFIGLVLITPSLHRLHHSAIQIATDSNFGLIFSFWDRLFGTFTAIDFMDQETMRLGLDELREAEHQHIFCLMSTPFLTSQKTPDYLKRV